MNLNAYEVSEIQSTLFRKKQGISFLPTSWALAYARLLAPSLFPRHSRIVYLDADTVLYADVAELYDTDLCGAAVGAVRDTAVLSSLVAGYPRRQLRKLQPLGLHDPFHYFNSGVLVLDLDRMREEDAEVRLLHVIEEHNELRPPRKPGKGC